MDEEKAETAGRKDGARPAGVGGADGPTWARELLDHLRPTGRHVRRVVTWLADTVQGTAWLQDGTGRLLAGTPAPLDENLLADLLSGRIASAAWDDAGRHLRLVRVEQPPPAPVGVLAVSRPAPFDRRTSDLVTHTAQVVELLLRARESTTAERRLQRAA